MMVVGGMPWTNLRRNPLQCTVRVIQSKNALSAIVGMLVLIVLREGGDIGLFITLVPKVL